MTDGSYFFWPCSNRVGCLVCFISDTSHNIYQHILNHFYSFEFSCNSIVKVIICKAFIITPWIQFSAMQFYTADSMHLVTTTVTACRLYKNPSCVEHTVGLKQMKIIMWMTSHFTCCVYNCKNWLMFTIAWRTIYKDQSLIAMKRNWSHTDWWASGLSSANASNRDWSGPVNASIVYQNITGNQNGLPKRI